MAQLYHDLLHTHALSALRPQIDDNDQPAPLGSQYQTMHIDILLRLNGELVSAQCIGRDDAHAKILMPTTDAAQGRTGNIVAFPFNEKLSYLAGDFPEANPQHAATYLAGLAAWAEGPHSHPAIQAVLAFIRQGTLYATLLALGVITDPSDEPDPEKRANAFKVLAGKWVRFRVAPAAHEADTISDQVWRRPDFWAAWAAQLATLPQDAPRGFCQLTGEQDVPLRLVSPTVPLPGAGKAKLISRNDPTDFTFRGRFRDAIDAVSIGQVASHKIHATLNWLLHRQGAHGLLIWERACATIPRFDSDSLSPEELEWFGFDAAAPSETYAGDFGRQYAQKLRQRMLGYASTLAGSAGIGILKLDSNNPGRTCIHHYQHMSLEAYLTVIEHWHEAYAWPQLSYDKLTRRLRVRVLAPHIHAILTDGMALEKGAHYTRLTRVLTDAILQRQRVPREIIAGCIARAQSIHRFPRRDDWEKCLEVSCALLRGNLQFTTKEMPPMGLDTRNTDRSYLFGRLLAVADEVEQHASRVRFARDNRQGGRFSRALQLQRRFASQPGQTWATVHERLLPYLANLTAGSAQHYQALIDELLAALADHPDFGRPLAPEYLLGFGAQRQAFRLARDARKAPTTADETPAAPTLH